MFSRPGLSAPLPYAHAGQLVTIGIKAPVLEFDFLFANDYLYLRQSTTPFTQITSGTGEPECELTQESPLRLTCAQVESNFLPTLGVNPILAGISHPKKIALALTTSRLSPMRCGNPASAPARAFSNKVFP